MLVAIGLVYLIMVIVFRSLLIGHASNIITGLAVSLQAAALPVPVIAAGMWTAYSVGDGSYDVARVASRSVAGALTTRLVRDALAVGVTTADIRDSATTDAVSARHPSAP